MSERAAGVVRHPFVELTLTRLLLMVREPEMLFWVFVFPILMTLALGLAFDGPGEAAAAPGYRYVDWLIPGLLGMNIMGTGMWGIGFTVVVHDLTTARPILQSPRDIKPRGRTRQARGD